MLPLKSDDDKMTAEMLRFNSNRGHQSAIELRQALRRSRARRAAGQEVLKAAQRANPTGHPFIQDQRKVRYSLEQAATWKYHPSKGARRSGLMHPHPTHLDTTHAGNGNHWWGPRVRLQGAIVIDGGKPLHDSAVE